MFCSSLGCTRGVTELKGIFLVNVCPESKKYCVKWMSAELRYKNERQTIGIMLNPNTYYHVSPIVKSMTVNSITLTSWKNGSVCHISIGTKKPCSIFPLESIYINDLNYVNYTKTYSVKKHGLTLYVVIAVVVLCFLCIPIACVFYKKIQLKKKDNYVLVKLLPEKRVPQFNITEDANEESSSEED